VEGFFLEEHGKDGRDWRETTASRLMRQENGVARGEVSGFWLLVSGWLVSRETDKP
jgi:hypothetical protein